MSMPLPSGLCHRSLFGQKIYKCKITLGTSKNPPNGKFAHQVFCVLSKIHVMVSAVHTLDFGHFSKIHPVVSSHIECSAFFLKSHRVGLPAQLRALIWAGQAQVCALGPTPFAGMQLGFGQRLMSLTASTVLSNSPAITIYPTWPRLGGNLDCSQTGPMMIRSGSMFIETALLMDRPEASEEVSMGTSSVHRFIWFAVPRAIGRASLAPLTLEGHLWACRSLLSIMRMSSLLSRAHFR